MWLVPAKHRTPSQQTMLRKAGAPPCGPLGDGAVVPLLIGFVIGNVVAAHLPDAACGSSWTTALVAVQNNRGLAVPFTLRDLERLPRESVIAELKVALCECRTAPQKLGLAYAIARYGADRCPVF